MTFDIKIQSCAKIALGVIIVGVSLVSCKKDNVPYDTKHKIGRAHV